MFDTNGVFIHPAEYDSRLQDGQIVEVDVILKMYVYALALRLLFLC